VICGRKVGVLSSHDRTRAWTKSRFEGEQKRALVLQCLRKDTRSSRTSPGGYRKAMTELLLTKMKKSVRGGGLGWEVEEFSLVKDNREVMSSHPGQYVRKAC